MDDATETEAEEDTASRCGGITEYDREMAGNQGCVVHETVVIMFPNSCQIDRNVSFINLPFGTPNIGTEPGGRNGINDG